MLNDENEIHNLTNGVNLESILLGLVKVPCLEKPKVFTIGATKRVLVNLTKNIFTEKFRNLALAKNT